MFTETDESRKTIGDVDVLYHEGLYHLFHLVLPNHDFIAHAVSTNGINWRRVSNALFIGDPGSWDDMMLWTMHVSPDPHQPGRWRMFYTGLSRRDQGRTQRVGMALSNDLYHWQKTPVHWRDLRGKNDPDLVKQACRISRSEHVVSRNSAYESSSCFPLEADARYYECSPNEGRHWISFRDPYYYHEDGARLLLVSARVNSGPVIRRGCVGVWREVGPHQFEPLPPLHHPGIYDDIEVPNLIKLGGEYYLIGSIREDAKIRYWHTDQIGHPWRSYHDNVLMAKGNYAGRVCKDPHGWLIWNFFSIDLADRTVNNLMPPPKRLVKTADGLLHAKTFEQFEQWLDTAIDTRCLRTLKEGLGDQHCSVDGQRLSLETKAGFQAFAFEPELDNFRFRANLELQGKGKCGIVFRVDPATHDGYYLSLDLLKCVAQLRAWKTGPAGSGEQMMQFQSLQSGYWHSETPQRTHVQLITFGSYLEFSVDGHVVLSLADQHFDRGLVGVYLETAWLELSDVELRAMRPPVQSDEHLVMG